jgi:hypothetical protein
MKPDGVLPSTNWIQSPLSHTSSIRSILVSSSLFRLRPQSGLLPFNKQTKINYVGFEILTAVVMKSTIFWDVTPCSPLSVNRRFGGTYRLHLLGRKIKLPKTPVWEPPGRWWR